MQLVLISVVLGMAKNAAVTEMELDFALGAWKLLVAFAHSTPSLVQTFLMWQIPSNQTVPGQHGISAAFPAELAGPTFSQQVWQEPLSHKMVRQKLIHSFGTFQLTKKNREQCVADAIFIPCNFTDEKQQQLLQYFFFIHLSILHFAYPSVSCFCFIFVFLRSHCNMCPDF